MNNELYPNIIHFGRGPLNHQGFEEYAFDLDNDVVISFKRKTPHVLKRRDTYNVSASLPKGVLHTHLRSSAYREQERLALQKQLEQHVSVHKNSTNKR